MQCHPGRGTFRYDVGGSPNPYWFMFTVSNTRFAFHLIQEPTASCVPVLAWLGGISAMHMMASTVDNIVRQGSTSCKHVWAVLPSPVVSLAREVCATLSRVPVQLVEYEQDGSWYGFRRTFPGTQDALLLWL